MKKVVNNDQVAHLWANQSQDNARNSGGSIYFEGDSIYSYGRHYKIARLYTKGSQTFAIINSRGYSPSTGSHTASVWRALDDKGLMGYYPDDPKKSLAAKVADFWEDYHNCFNQNANGYSGTWLCWKIERLNETIKKHNTACDFFELDDLKLELTELHLELLKEKDAFLKIRHAELNTPEAIAKLGIDKVKRAEAKERKIERDRLATIEKRKQDVIKWRQGGRAYVAFMQPQIIRVKDNALQTSGGAEVALSEAIKLLKSILDNTAKTGDSVGDFTFEGVSDGVAKIGCHRVSLDEAQSQLGKYLVH